MTTEAKIRIDRIAHLLDGLGTHEDVVAEALNEKGIKGFIESTFSCPIAQLVKEEVYPGVQLTQEVFAVTDEYVKTPDGKVALPVPVAAFITRFDEGNYPDLDLMTGDEEDE